MTKLKLKTTNKKGEISTLKNSEFEAEPQDELLYEKGYGCNPYYILDIINQINYN